MPVSQTRADETFAVARASDALMAGLPKGGPRRAFRGTAAARRRPSSGQEVANLLPGGCLAEPHHDRDSGARERQTPSRRARFVEGAGVRPRRKML